MPNISVIDSHVHLWDPIRHSIPWITDLPALNRSFGLAEFDEARADVVVEGMVFLECDVATSDAMAEVDWVAGLAKADGRLKAIVASVPLEKGDAVTAELSVLAEYGKVRGVRRILQGEADPSYCLRPEFLSGVRKLSDFDLSFDICVNHTQLPNVIPFAQQCPDVRMVLDHIGKPDIRGGGLEPWASHIRELARLPNVWLKMSGVATEADHQTWTRDQLKPYILAAIEAFGFERTMFGGDWPVATLAIGYGAWIDTLDWAIGSLSDCEQQMLYRDTAVSFYRL
ncbi:MAG: amidohydrolase family protein [Pseudomonadota bacterium]